MGGALLSRSLTIGKGSPVGLRRAAEGPAGDGCTTDDGRTVGELVFFQHDELVVHTRNPDAAAAHLEASVAVATRLLFGDTAVRFPMKMSARTSYAEGDEPAPDDTEDAE